MANDIEFLRYLIDYIDSKKEPEIEVEPEIEPQAAPTIIINVQQDDEDGNFESDECEYGEEHPEDVENPMDRDDVFIPPLQAKLEIMKKMAGIPGKHQDLLTGAADEDEPFEG